MVATDKCTESATQLWHLNETAASTQQGFLAGGQQLFRIVHAEKGLCLTALAAQPHALLTLSPCSRAVVGAALQQWAADADHRLILANSTLALNIGIPLFSPSSLLQLYPVQANAGNEVFVLPANATVVAVGGSGGGAIRTTVPAGGCLDVL